MRPRAARKSAPSSFDRQDMATSRDVQIMKLQWETLGLGSGQSPATFPLGETTKSKIVEFRQNHHIGIEAIPREPS